MRWTEKAARLAALVGIAAMCSFGIGRGAEGAVATRPAGTQHSPADAGGGRLAGARFLPERWCGQGHGRRCSSDRRSSEICLVARVGPCWFTDPVPGTNDRYSDSRVRPRGNARIRPDTVPGWRLPHLYAVRRRREAGPHPYRNRRSLCSRCESWNRNARPHCRCGAPENFPNISNPIVVQFSRSAAESSPPDIRSNPSTLMS